MCRHLSVGISVRYRTVRSVPVCGCGCRIISANLLICQNPVNNGKSDIPILSITVHIYCGVNVYTRLRLSNNITIMGIIILKNGPEVMDIG